MKRVYRFLIMIAMFFAHCNAMYAQPANKIISFCPDTVFASDNMAHYAEDNFFMAVGNTYIPTVAPNNIFTAKIDLNGNVLKKRYISHKDTNIHINSFDPDWGGVNALLAKLGKDTYVTVGNENDDTVNKKIRVFNPFFYIFNKDCDSVMFTKGNDTLVSRIPYSVTTDQANNILVTGMISSKHLYYNVSGSNFGWDSTYIWLAKYDNNLNLLWEKQYSPWAQYGKKPGLVMGYKVMTSSKLDAYLICGLAFNSSDNGFGSFIMKTDLSGNVIWMKFISRPFPCWNDLDLIALKDGGYAFVSTQNLTGNCLTSAIYYGKLDQNGDSLWIRTFTKYPDARMRGKQIAEAANGDLLFTSRSDFKGNALIRTTPDGLLKWYREYEYKDTDLYKVPQVFTSMSLTPGKNILLSGYVSNVAIKPGFFDSSGIFSWYVITDSFGCLEPGCQLGDTIYPGAVSHIYGQDFKVYPNPAYDELFVDGIKTKTTVTVYDIMGRRVYSNKTSKSKETIPVQNWPQGTYIIRLENGASRVVKKIQKE